MMKYSNVFKPETIDYELYKKFYGLVMSRCFKMTIAGTALVPMADMYNHYHY